MSAKWGEFLIKFHCPLHSVDDFFLFVLILMFWGLVLVNSSDTCKKNLAEASPGVWRGCDIFGRGSTKELEGSEICYI